VRLSRSRIRRLLQTLAVEDWRILCKLAVWKFSHPLFNVYYIFEFDLARAHELSPALLPAGITIRLFRGEREISPLATLLVEAGLSAATVEQQMRRGDLVALALTDDGKLAAYAWATYSDVWIPEVRAGLSPLLGLFHLRHVSPEADITLEKKKPSLTTVDALAKP
jgi:hypothetical protein